MTDNEKEKMVEGLGLGVIMVIVVAVIVLLFVDPVGSTEKEILKKKRYSTSGKYYKVETKEITRSEYDKLGEEKE